MELSERSKKNLATAHPLFTKLMNEVMKGIDCEVICGHRDEADQNKAVASGVSKVSWPHGKHNAMPSNAIDVIPIPIDWNNISSFINLSITIKMKAKELGIPIIWGGDWKMRDYPHYELNLSKEK